MQPGHRHPLEKSASKVGQVNKNDLMWEEAAAAAASDNRSASEEENPVMRRMQLNE